MRVFVSADKRDGFLPAKYVSFHDSDGFLPAKYVAFIESDEEIHRSALPFSKNRTTGEILDVRTIFKKHAR